MSKAEHEAGIFLWRAHHWQDHEPETKLGRMAKLAAIRMDQRDELLAAAVGMIESKQKEPDWGPLRAAVKKAQNQ